VRYQPPPVWGVLCIDCWEADGTNDEFYRRVLQELRQYPIGAVVNSTIDLRIDYQDRSVYNTFRNYLWAADSINTQVNDRALLDLARCAGHQQTNHVLHDQLFDDTTVHLTSRETFLHQAHYYWPEIKDWIVVGSAWGYCLHTGPMGVNTLVDIPGHRFHFFADWSVQDEDRNPPTLQNIHDDYYVWAPIDGDGYRLITRANNHKWAEGKWTESATT
jgi:hypothetical protein